MTVREMRSKLREKGAIEVHVLLIVTIVIHYQPMMKNAFRDR